MKRLAGPIQVFDEFDNPAFVVELFAFVVALIAEIDPHAAVQERQFLQPFVERVVDEVGGLERSASRA